MSSKPKNKAINDSKVLYRIQHYKDFQNALLTINGGTIIAFMAYLGTISGTKEHIRYGLIGLACLGTAVTIHVFLLFANYITLGLIHDGEDKMASDIGKVILTPLVLLSLALTPLGFLGLFIFIAYNV